MHALMQSMEFQLSRCQCQVAPVKCEEPAMVEILDDVKKREVVDEFDALNVLDSVNDDVLSSTPL